ncbi:hypothetical protein [Luteibacter aegosomatissinici]|uniref:hypothetical protein n=1 Tax=Luteibacter aegosomatissinici TaxID=2911539 RepID=UPI001FF8B3A1|nr:hypothetical protein [Luteibacter aegosomatissinici]UPG95538.1 hypothetical protein L2Y97_05365 [Luteibacter aegosomatissinici]
MPLFRPHKANVALALFVAAFGTGAVYATPPGDQPPPSFGAATPVEALKDMTGGTDTHVNNITDQETTGTVGNNTNFSIGNGDPSIGGSAFSNAAGINTAVQNTGNNVLIQNSTIVNVKMN